MTDIPARHGCDLDHFNSLDVPAAVELLRPCLAVPRWVEEVVSGRPYADVAGLRKQASASAQELTDDELDSALTEHPRIGERPSSDNAEARFSRSEQASAGAVDDVVAQAIREGNAAYESRFQRVFLIRAAGRSSDEILAELRRRLGSDDRAERRETVAQLREIALLRLDQVVRP